MFRNTSAQCNQEVFKSGCTVFCIGDLGKDEIETWVKKVAEQSGQQVDWHYSGGRANILGLGDLEKICKTIKKMLPELNKTINEYGKEKWGVNSNRDTFREEDVDYWNNRDMYQNFSISNN